MAEQTPFCIADNLLMKLGSTVFHEIGLVYGVVSELRKLEETLSTVRAVLVDAEEKQESSHAVAVWVRRLNDVVYDADDLLDDFATEDLRRKSTDDRRRFARQVSDFFSSSNHLAFRFKMGHRIKGIRERLDDIGNDIPKFNFIPRVVISGNRGRETCSVVEKSHKIVGRDEAKKHIIELLMQSSTSQENLSMIGIVGMGGLGKTTLAQLVYNDRRVADYFDLKMWACVSDDFDVKILVRNIIKSATNKGVEDLELDQLQQHLQQYLDGKRYLLVLDDVWNDDVPKWGQFMSLLPVGADGSKVLVTTRSTRVASVMGIDSPYTVESLKDEESWELFQSVAFKKGEEKMHPNLVAIGKDIVKMCKGVPLVIRTLGGILSFNTQENHWLSIKDNKNLVLLRNKNDIMPVLRLSYDNLPIHLRQCFAYCALFSKDYIFQKQELVQLWMAQGYIQPVHENECLEDIGDEYFEDLLTRSLYEVVEHEDFYDEIMGYKMHDLIHDLAQSVVKSDIIILTDNVIAIPKRVHHVSLSRATNEVPKDLMDKPIRTLFMECCSDDHYIINRCISSLKCLRVMRMRLGQQKLPTSLGKLSHLRYLDLCWGSFENLPSSITRLKHLQTLKLNQCQNLKELPRNMKKLINLRHLEINGCIRLSYMPHGLGELTHLQTLPLFLVGNDCGECRKKRIGGLSELKSLNNLRGQLVISGLSNARGSEAKEAKLEGKHYLDHLTLYWRGSVEATSEESEEEAVSVMESLQPNQNLKELSMCDYGGVRFPNWMMNDRLDMLLPNLVTIQIFFCKRCQVLPPFGELPSLKHLHLRNLPAVEYMKDPLSANPFFPSLKILMICDMHNLKGWGRRDVTAKQTPSYPYLEHLYLTNISTELCLHLISVPSSLKSLEISGMENVTSLPEGLQHLSTLQTLQIGHCSELTTLPGWIGLLSSLTKLIIYNCCKLASLPKEMRSLRNLITLRIKDCPYLSERCQRETGEDWPKISHIRQILIDKEWWADL